MLILTRSRSALLVAAVVCWSAPACDEPTGPAPGGSTRVVVGPVITGQFGDDSVRRFSFLSAADRYAVFAESERSIQIMVVDSTTKLFVRQLFVRPGISLDEFITSAFAATPGHVYHLDVLADPRNPGGEFRFRVYRVDPNPERLPQRFAFGDTVTGEDIEVIVDVDNFLVAGEAGQEFVAVVEALDTQFADLSLTVFDGGNSYGGMGAYGGQSATATTGRNRLPATKDYRFEVRPTGVYDHYRGRYRFWSYFINRAPEQIVAAVPLQTAITGEKVDKAGDVDEFTFASAPGQEFNAFLHAGRPFILEVAQGSQSGFVAVAPEPGDTGLFQRATGRFSIPAGQAPIVRIGTDGREMADTGAYRFFLYPIDRAPESVPVAIWVGDTVTGETIDLAGDIDEFTFEATAGESYDVAFQRTSGLAERVLRLEAVNPAGVVVRVNTVAGLDANLQRTVGAFTAEVSGTHRVRARGETDRTNRDVGSYRLIVYRINP